LASALTAGVAVAFSSLTGVGLLVASALGAALASSFFLANFISVFGASALAGAAAGADAAGAGAAATGVFAGCANADAIPKEAMIAIANVFIGVSFKLMKM
jgi:hypothetical protein